MGWKIGVLWYWDTKNDVVVEYVGLNGKTDQQQTNKIWWDRQKYLPDISSLTRSTHHKPRISVIGDGQQQEEIADRDFSSVAKAPWNGMRCIDKL